MRGIQILSIHQEFNLFQMTRPTSRGYRRYKIAEGQWAGLLLLFEKMVHVVVKPSNESSHAAEIQSDGRMY